MEVGINCGGNSLFVKLHLVRLLEVFLIYARIEGKGVSRVRPAAWQDLSIPSQGVPYGVLTKKNFTSFFLGLAK